MTTSLVGWLLVRAQPRLVAVGQRLLPHLPERLSRAILASVFRRWPESWGMSSGSERVKYARSSYRLAFPEGDPDAFLSRWTASRADALATGLTYMARVNAGRESGLIRRESPLALPPGGPCVVALLHYSIEPVVQLVLIADNPGREFRWVVFPTEPADNTGAWEDDRALWLAADEIPPRVAQALLPIGDSRWVVEALSHMRQGGDVLIDMDVGFDSRRPATASVTVGHAHMPVAPSIDLLSRATPAARLLFARPEPSAEGTWGLRLDAVSDTSELADAAERWISDHAIDWTGWPWIAGREDPTAWRGSVAAERVGEMAQAEPSRRP